MALFKIFKGNNSSKLTDSSVSGYRTPTDGYAYYDTSTKLFYIDADYTENQAGTISRQPINAEHANTATLSNATVYETTAEVGSSLNPIRSYYAHGLSSVNGALSLTNGSGIELSNISLTYYGTCSTAKTTVAKTVSIPSVTALYTGLSILVKFTNSNTAANPTLKVNNLDAIEIKRYGTTAPSTSAASSWNAGAVVQLIYDGTYWQMEAWNNTTYSGMTTTEISAGTGTSARTITPANLKTAIQTWAISSITAGAGLNITSNDAGTDGGTITSTGTLYLTKSGVTANTYGNTSQQTPSHGGTFNIPYFTVDKYGRITSANTTTVKLPSDNNTDTLVKQTVKSDNVNYKLLMGANSSPTSGTAYEAVYDTNITVNPSTDTITATTFAGNATTATTLSSTLPISLGGTGAITAEDAWTSLGGGSVGKLNYGSDTTKFLRNDGTWTAETDPTVPSWAKATNKPSYSLNEITGTEDVQAIEALDGTSGFLVKNDTNSWYLDTTNYVTQSEIDTSIGDHNESLAIVWNFVSSNGLNDNATITLDASLMSLAYAAQQKHLQFYVLWETANSHVIKFEIDEINMATNTAKFHSNCGNILYTIEINSNSITESPMTGNLSVKNLYTLTIGSNSCQVFASQNINIPIYNGTIS